MEILYVSSVPSKKEFYDIKSRIRKGINVASYGMNESGFKFHSLILDGLSENNDIDIFSLVGRSVSHKTHRGIVWRAKEEAVKKNLNIKHLGFLNIPVIKQLIICFSYFFNVLAWLNKNRSDEKYIIVDAAYVTVIPFVLSAAKTARCKTAAVFCDIYEYMGNVKDARETENVGALHRLLRGMMKRSYKKLSGFILLTQQMNRVVNPLGKPYLIVEGLVDINMKLLDNKIEDKADKNVVMYAGALREQYGLKNLIDGFMDYKNENGRLWIYGAGDYAENINQAAQADSRIIFFGLADNEEVVKKETIASVLINPRPADREFTQYSFPSKNMEYMVSGTPVMTTRLPGMPGEYYEHIYTIDGNEAKDITEALYEVFSHTKEELHSKGRRAKRFVLENKNNIIQAQKITGLLQGLK